MSNRNENNDYPLNHGSKKYVVYVDDNFHHMDESERYKLGEFSSCEEAVEVCKKIVDEFFSQTYDENITYEELNNGYTMYGEDPFIVSGDAISYNNHNFEHVLIFRCLFSNLIICL